MHVKRIHEMLECLTKCAESQLDKGIECVDTEEMSKVIDIIKDLACAEKDCYEKEYYEEIIEAMEESEYGEDYDYHGRKHYDDYRYERTGRYAPKGRGTYMGHGGRRGYEEREPYYHMQPESRMSVNDYRTMSPENLRDVDRKNGRMYYTEMENEHQQSKLERMRTEYKNRKDMDALTHYADAIKEDVLDIWADMPSDQRTTLKTKLTALIQKM